MLTWKLPRATLNTGPKKITNTRLPSGTTHWLTGSYKASSAATCGQPTDGTRQGRWNRTCVASAGRERLSSTSSGTALTMPTSVNPTLVRWTKYNYKPLNALAITTVNLRLTRPNRVLGTVELSTAMPMKKKRIRQNYTNQRHSSYPRGPSDRTSRPHRPV